MTKTICKSLSLHSVFLYQLQPHSQQEYTIAKCQGHVICNGYKHYKINQKIEACAIVAMHKKVVKYLFIDQMDEWNVLAPVQKLLQTQ